MQPRCVCIAFDILINFVKRIPLEGAILCLELIEFIVKLEESGEGKYSIKITETHSSYFCIPIADNL